MRLLLTLHLSVLADQLTSIRKTCAVFSEPKIIYSVHTEREYRTITMSPIKLPKLIPHAYEWLVYIFLACYNFYVLSYLLTYLHLPNFLNITLEILSNSDEFRETF